MNDIKQGNISIIGLSELEKVLTEFPDRLAKNILIGGVRAGANVFRSEARQRATVAEKEIIRKFHGQKITVQPGFMQKKIASWRAQRTEYAVTFNIGIAGWKDRFTKFFPFYWRFLEFGTSKMAAKPFLRPAFEGKKTQAVEAMRDYMDARIDKEAPRQVSI
jgi:HK97 gp10 family phage protein